MGNQSERTEPFVATSIAEVLEQITAHVAKGFFHYSVLRSWNDTTACDLEIVEEIERIRSEARAADVIFVVKYFRLHLTGLILSTKASFFGPKSRYGDIRQSPLDFDLHRVSCIETDVGVYETRLSISPDWFQILKEKLTRMSCEDSLTTVAENIRRLLEVRSPEIECQAESILRAVNEKRKAAGLEIVGHDSVGLAEGADLQ